MFLTASFVTCNSFYCLWHFFSPTPSALRSGCESQFPTSEALHPLQTTLAQPGIVSVRVGLSYDPLRFSLRCPMCFNSPCFMIACWDAKRVFWWGFAADRVVASCSCLFLLPCSMEKMPTHHDILTCSEYTKRIYYTYFFGSEPKWHSNTLWMCLLGWKGSLQTNFNACWAVETVP